MANRWPTSTVAALQAEGALLVEDGNHGEYRPRRHEFVDDGVPFIRAADMDGGRVLFDAASRIDDTALARVRKGIGQSGDILLSHKGTVGKVASVPLACEPFVCSPQTTFWRVLDQTRLDRTYLFAHLKSPIFAAQLDARKSETDMADYVSLTNQRTLEVVLPPIETQRAIAHILGTLDDKIELNRRMNETLEAMAQALFKSWFVDFDPVRAKHALSNDEGAEGRDTGLPAELAALFPDRFVESELGEVPEGWEVGANGDIAANPCRSVQPDSIEPSTPYIGLEHMPRQSIALGDWGEAEAVASAKSRFSRGDILFGKLRPYFHKVGVAPIDGVCSTDILVIVPRHRQWFGFLLGHASSVEFVNHADATSTGTRMPRTKWRDLAAYAVALPPPAMVQAFSEAVKPLVRRIERNVYESRTLAATRDALLPKLVSGELRVGDEVTAFGEVA